MLLRELPAVSPGLIAVSSGGGSPRQIGRAVLNYPRFQFNFIMGIHNQYSNLFRHSPEKTDQVIYVHDLTGKFTFLNPAGEQLLGYSCEEARHMTIKEVLRPEDADRVLQQTVSGVTRSIGAVYEVEMIARDGQRLPLEVSVRVVFADGQPVEIEGIAVPSILRQPLT